MQRFSFAFFVVALGTVAGLAVAPGGTIPHSHEIDKALHVGAFAVLMGLAGAVVHGRIGRLLAAAGLLAFGGLLELGQAFVPQHETSLGDILGNVAGVVLALTFLTVLDLRRIIARPIRAAGTCEPEGRSAPLQPR